MQLIDEIKISKIYNRGDIPFDLLLLADPSMENINKYIKKSEIYVAEINNELVGCYVLEGTDKDTAEIKNIAVVEQFQGKGIGKRLLLDAIGRSKINDYQKIIIGTANTSFGQLYLYQKAGFRFSRIITDFFIDNYEEEIWENGLQCKDMIILSRDL